MSILNFFRNRNNSNSDRYILCLDGGGMRGVVPVKVLQKLESALRELGATKAVQSYFDLIAGTSTGGLIASGLVFPDAIATVKCSDTKQVNLQELEQIYMTVGKNIFPSGKGLKSLVNVPHQVIDNKYPVDGLETLLYKWFANVKLSDAKVPTLLMAYNLSQGCEAMLKSYEANDITVVQACRATSAAPTYFEPLEYGKELYADGGLIANNPSLYAYMEAKKMYPECEKFHILSIGTASQVHRTSVGQTSGLLDWIDQISPMYITAQKKTVEFAISQFKDVDYIRIDEEFSEDIKMDDVRDKSMQKLQTFGSELADKYEDSIRSFAKSLINHK